MEFHKGYYSLIQYCPDPSRLEAANVGVLLFCPELDVLETRLVKDNGRIRRFLGEQDWLLVDGAKEAIAERLSVDRQCFRTVEDEQDFIASRANGIQISDLRPMKMDDPETDLDRLFRRLVVEPEPHRSPRRRGSV